MDNKQGTKCAYNSIANLYYEEYKDDITDLIYIDEFLKSKKKILDLGCGMGHYSKYISDKGFSVTGVDFSENMIAIAKNICKNGTFILSDVCDLPSDLSRDFDGVLIAYVLQHLSVWETRKMFLNLHNSILDNCDLLIFLTLGNGVINEKEPFNPLFEYELKLYSLDEIYSLLEECGYKVLKYYKKPFKADEFALGRDTIILFVRNSNRLNPL